jgi:hypothetical protein
VPNLTVNTITKGQWEALSPEKPGTLLEEGITAHKAAGGDIPKPFIEHIVRYESLLSASSDELINLIFSDDGLEGSDDGLEGSDDSDTVLCSTTNTEARIPPFPMNTVYQKNSFVEAISI